MNKFKMHEYKAYNGQGDFIYRILQGKKDRKIASEKLKYAFGSSFHFLKLKYSGLVSVK